MQPINKTHSAIKVTLFYYLLNGSFMCMRIYREAWSKLAAI